MGTNYLRFLIKVLLCVCVLVLFSQQPAQARSQSSDDQTNTNTYVFLPLVLNGASEEVDDSFPSLQEFSASVITGDRNRLTGVYVQDIFAYPVVLQPEGDYAFISAAPDVLTQYRLAAEVGVTGILAHNYLAGKKFFELTGGIVIDLIFGDGSIIPYEVIEITQYQVIEPNKTTSSMIDLQTGTELSAAEVFARHYMNEGQVTFQTCISKNGISTWGRIFIVTEPVQ